MLELLFLMGFSLHNIEEALLVPKWSENIPIKYRPKVLASEFRFAAMGITIAGYLLTLQYYLFSEKYILSKYIYFGFVLMMVINVIFPHVLATIFFQKYAPGLITGILLNIPIGLYLIIVNIKKKEEVFLLLTSTLIISVFTIVAIKLLFELGKK